MVTKELNEIYLWAKKHLNQPVLLDYRLDKVNGQLAGKVGLLRQSNDPLPGAELEIDYFPDQPFPYLASFSVLPFRLNQPRLQPSRSAFATQREVIAWLVLRKPVAS